MTAEEAMDVMKHELFLVRQEIHDNLNGFLNRYNADANGLKEVRQAIGGLSRSQAEHGIQILGMLKYLGITPFKAADSSPQSIENPESDEPQLSRTPLPIPDWKTRCEAEAATLEKELPDPSTIADLMKRFGVSYTKIRNLIMSRKLPIAPCGEHRWMIPRESILAYVRAYGVPQPKPRPQFVK